MIKGMITLASYGAFSGGGFGEVLSQFEQLGVFSYVLPFLLIFAIVFGIMEKSKIFDNKGLNSVIAISIGLLALQFEFVPEFFSIILPRVGIGLSVLLGILILLGLALPSEKWVNYALVGIAAVITIAVLVSTGDYFGYGALDFVREHSIFVLFIGVIVLIVVAFSKGSGGGSQGTSAPSPMFAFQPQPQ
jgi:hypothetical protein